MKKYFGFIAFLALTVAAPLTWAQDADRYYGEHMMWGGGWGGWFLGPLMMIIWLSVAVAVVVFVARIVGGGGHHRHYKMHGRDASEILKARFARGDISKEEYLEAKKLLEE